jgi:hypothetical protein
MDVTLLQVFAQHGLGGLILLGFIFLFMKSMDIQKEERKEWRETIAHENEKWRLTFVETARRSDEAAALIARAINKNTEHVIELKSQHPQRSNVEHKK